MRPTESELERMFSRNVIRRHALPAPCFQYGITIGSTTSYRIDFCYPDTKLAIEVLGWRFHAGKRAWERDLNRHNVLVESGWLILYFTWSDITKRPAFVAEQVARSLVARSKLFVVEKST